MQTAYVKLARIVFSLASQAVLQVVQVSFCLKGLADARCQIRTPRSFRELTVA